MEKKLCVVVSHSGYGHTQKLAEQVVVGVSGIAGVTATHVQIGEDGTLQEADWDLLNEANGIVFGCPTYMAGPSWQFKRFADTTSKIWAEDGWRNKLASGFTNSGAVNGDKANTITYLFSLAMQHGMFWIGTGLKPANTKEAKRDDLNYMGGFTGLLAQAPVDSTAEEGPPAGDLRTARHFGRRFGRALLRLCDDMNPRE